MIIAEPQLDFKLITERSELITLSDAWQQLHADSAGPAAMLDPGWLLLWLRHYGSTVELAVGLLYDRDALVGLAPLCIRRYTYRPGLVFRRLQFLGIDANESDGVCSEYMGFVARRGYDDMVARQFVALIAADRFGSCHEVVLASMNGDDRSTTGIEADLRAVGFSCDKRINMTGYYVRLPTSWDAYLQSLSSSRRYRLKNSMAKFVEWAGEKSWKLEHATTLESFSNGFAQLKALHGERWASDGSAGAFASPRFTEFHEAFIAAQAGSGNVGISWLKVGDGVVAVIYIIRNGRKVLAYQYGRVVGTPTRVRVGIVINALMIQEAIARGDEEFDFLGGDSRYKVDFATHKRPIVTLRAVRLNAHEFVRLGLVGVRDGFVKVVTFSRQLRRRVMPSAAPSASEADASDMKADTVDSR